MKKLLLAAICLATLSACAHQPKAGDSKDSVIERMGLPAARTESDGYEVWHYVGFMGKDCQVLFRGGRAAGGTRCVHTRQSQAIQSGAHQNVNYQQ